jgi:23S rRNA (adenine2030-N6)-methyltransferase
MANRHFAALGDVWKHLPLAEILRLRPPAQYWETHAGSPAYALTESPTRVHGAIRFLSVAPTDPTLGACSYLEALRSQQGVYPGSPALAMHALGKSASYLFCDLDAESVRDLRDVGTDFHVSVVEGDGVARVLREANDTHVKPSDALVHIDPYDPHDRVTSDSMTPVELAAELAERGYRVFYWYGYESLDQRGWARNAIARLAPNVDLWCGDMLIPSPFVFPERGGVWGCGVVLANMTAAEAESCARLGAALERVSADDVQANNEPSRLAFAVIR